MNQYNKKPTFLLDWDGTIFWGGRPMKGARDFVSCLLQSGSRVFFLTNNSSRNAYQYEEILKSYGMWNENCHVITSGQVTAWYIREKLGIDEVFIIGTHSLIKEFYSFGINNTLINPQAVVLGFDKKLTYSKIQRGHELICNGTPFIATHDDKRCPLPHKTLVDCGSMIEMFKTSTGINPLIIGKPHDAMCDYVRANVLNPGNHTFMVGDRHETDGLMAEKLGIEFLFINNDGITNKGESYESIKRRLEEIIKNS
jgi:HAD superfamily hydrolase (TIGR01450 family)